MNGGNGMLMRVYESCDGWFYLEVWMVYGHRRGGIGVVDIRGVVMDIGGGVVASYEVS